MDNYQKNIETYKKLGKQYADNLKKFDLLWADEFMKILPKVARILDIGCAGGRDSRKFSDFGLEVIGIDAVDVFISEAKRFVPKAKFYEMDLQDLDFPENYFDAIWANAVLLHFPRKNAPAILKGFKKVLKKGGKIHISVKYGRGEKWVIDKLSGGHKRFFSYFTKKEMENYIKFAGFKIILSKINDDPDGRKELKWINIWGEKA